MIVDIESERMVLRSGNAVFVTLPDRAILACEKDGRWAALVMASGTLDLRVGITLDDVAPEIAA